jgi:hypothetical protein
MGAAVESRPVKGLLTWVFGPLMNRLARWVWRHTSIQDLGVTMDDVARIDIRRPLPKPETGEGGTGTGTGIDRQPEDPS